MRVFLATTLLCLVACFATGAQAHGRHHYRHHHRHYVIAHHTQHREISEIASAHLGLTHVKLDDGQVITVAAAYADRFAGFLNALYHREGRLPEVGCYSMGHMARSLHHGGLACDVGQSERNKAWAPMYHVTELAEKFGLFDGCHIHNPGPDCGHIDVSNVVGSHFGGGTHYALRGHRHYAARRHHYRHYAKG